MEVCLTAALLFMMIDSVTLVTEDMGDLTFVCPEGWTIQAPNCYLITPSPRNFMSAQDTCKKYGANLVILEDEVESLSVSKLVRQTSSSIDTFWIGNIHLDGQSVCGGVWDIMQPADLNSTYVSSRASNGRWSTTDPDTRQPFVCKVPACLEGTFRCLDGSQCLNEAWKCDGVYDCPDQSDEADCKLAPCSSYIQKPSGSLNVTYEANRPCTWVIEGVVGQILSITFHTVDLESDADYIEVWSGGPTIETSTQKALFTGSVRDQVVYGDNNFLIIRLISDNSVEGPGFTATWQTDPELSFEERMVEATDSWTEVTSPHYHNSQRPSVYFRLFTVNTTDGSHITMEIMDNQLMVNDFVYNPQELSSIVSSSNSSPLVFVSLGSSFTFHISSKGNNTRAFRARVKRGCSPDLTVTSGVIESPGPTPTGPYPSSLTCTYNIRAPSDQPRGFMISFVSFKMADDKDEIMVYNVTDSVSNQMYTSSRYTMSSQLPQHLYSGSVFVIQFTSSLAQSDGYFALNLSRDCPTVADATNMILSTPLSHAFTFVSISCNQGYSFAQEEFVNSIMVSLTCSQDGNWDKPRMPTCRQTYCGVPQTIANGEIYSGSGNARYGAIVQYRCFPGFRVNGSSTSTCQENGQWTLPPECLSATCPSPSTIVNGSLTFITGNSSSSADRQYFGAIVMYTCHPGYDLIGSMYSLCYSGIWSMRPPVCQAIKCPVPEVDRATLSTQSPVELGKSLIITCNPGYTNNGTDSFQSTCTSSGMFDVPRNACQDKNECEIAGICGAHQICHNTDGNFTCVCENGFTLTSGRCEDIDECANNTSGCDVTNGYCNNTSGGFTCGCNSGYTMYTQNGTTGKNIPLPEDGLRQGDVYYINHTCVPVTCPSLPSIPHGTLLSASTSYVYNETAGYRCDRGYTLTGSAVVRCQSNGQWSATPPTCNPRYCAALSPTGIVSAVIPQNPTVIGDKVTLVCRSQVGPEYNKTLYCAYDSLTDNMTLQGDSPNCPAIDCGSPSLVATGGSVNVSTSSGLGESFEFSCEPGFVVTGESTLGNRIVRCGQDGRWGFGTLYCKDQRCTDPGTPGVMNMTSASFDVNGTVTYTCLRPGFVARPDVRTCVYENGQVTWDGSTPVCVDIERPVFLSCPAEVIYRNIYTSAAFPMPSATDNSGLVLPIKVSPPGFRLDMPLSESFNVNFTASDVTGNTATCLVAIIVRDTVSPDLTCPDYLQFNVSSNTSYTVDLQTAGNITGANLTFHPDRMVQVGPTTVGVAPYHVTTTDKYGFERQCAFMVDIRPTECLSDYLTPGGATMQCTSQEGEGLNCTVTCDAGMAFQDGSTTETYSCSEQNVWSPTLPARSCSPTVVPRYIYMVAINYTWDGTGSISSCLNQSAGELVAVIPTRTVTPCSIDGGPPYITFNASVFSLDNNATNLVLELTVANLTSISSSDLEYCRSIFSTPFSLRANDFFKIQSTNCTEETGSVTFTPDSRNVTRNGYVCPRGTTLQLVNAQQLCVQCEPGYMENEGQCIECPSGQYQNETGQTECKTCAGSFSSSPRVSASQCVACPPGQYPVNSTSCSPCPRGYYKTLTSYYKCTECPDDTTTSSTGSSASTDCIPLTSPACENGGTPIIYFHEFTCTCPEGYYGTTCENWIDPCAPNPCYNYGSCIRQGINYTCWCPPGFTGNQCQVDSQNNCQNNTCSDIRFCRDKINSADCVCPSVGNYTGPQCAVPQDLCSSSPCKNGATCQNFPGVRYTCKCQPGYTGSTCETLIDQCALNSHGCLYGGQCTNGINNYTCSCQQSYQGSHCQQTPDYCNLSNPCLGGVCYNDYNMSKALCACSYPYRLNVNSGRCEEIDVCSERRPCQNNATCQRVSPGQFHCACPQGYEGSLCQHIVRSCTNSSCVHGQCVDVLNNYTCVCDAGYTGRSCEVDVNDCPGQCVANNTLMCIDGVNQYTCSCKAGFTGVHCETNINECASLPCKHNGACVESVTPGDYNCTCRDGWTGKNCDTLPVFCRNDSCQNGGVCYNLQDRLFCSCQAGTHGNACNETTNICSIVSPCVNPNQCQSRNETASCNCPQNYTGGSCQLVKDFCSPNPCPTGQCVTTDVGYSCQCQAADNCTTTDHSCASLTCPSGSSCVETASGPLCLCHPGYLLGGGVCKNTSSDFDIYFTRRSNTAVRALQPFTVTGQALSLTFWISFLDNSSSFPVQLISDRMDRVLLVSQYGVTFGGTFAVNFTDYNGSPQSLPAEQKWTFCAITWSVTGHYKIYIDSVELPSGSGIPNGYFPSLGSLLYPYIGEDFAGYISQLNVWNGTLTSQAALALYANSDAAPSSLAPAYRWAEYQFNSCVKLISPSTVKRDKAMCQMRNYGNECANDTVKTPPVANCSTTDLKIPTYRQIQLFDHMSTKTIFPGDYPVFTNMNGTLLTFGAYHVVYASRDTAGNVAMCRFNVYVQREGHVCNSGEADSGDSTLTSCAAQPSLGESVTCPVNSSVMPFTPKVLTCGKLGSYNLGDLYTLPPAQPCSDFVDAQVLATLSLKYQLSISCGTSVAASMKSNLQNKVKTLAGTWQKLCNNSNCDSVNVNVVCNSNTATASLIFHDLPAQLTSGNVTYTVTELLKVSAIEQDTFVISFVANSVLIRDEVTVTIQMTCRQGYGRFGAGCVQCVAGSFLNSATNMCEQCAVGTYTNSPGQTQCTPCPQNQTTLRVGSTSCVEKCSEGGYYNLTNNACQPCFKNFYQPNKGSVACFPCPPNSFTAGPGTVSLDKCRAACPPGSDMQDTSCVPCARGSYRTGLVADDKCQNCSASNTTATTNSTSSIDCYQPACSPGYMRNSTTNQCELCPYGYYQPEQWQDTCIPCNINYTTNNTGSTSSSDCIFVCPAGSEDLGNHTCQPCPRGSYRANSLQDRFLRCTACNTSFTTVTTGSTSSNDCNITACSPGYMRNSSTNQCVQCDYSFYQPSRWQDMCFPCNTSYTTNNTGSTNPSDCKFVCPPGYEDLGNQTCQPCQQGYFRSNSLADRFRRCTACNAAFTTAGFGSTSSDNCNITACSPGYMRIAITNQCVLCPYGYYQPLKWQDECISCNTSYTTNNTGSTSTSDCIFVCPAGSEDIGNHTCQSCPRGSYRANSLQDRFLRCTACNTSFTTVTTGSSSSSDCNITACSPGYMRNSSTNQCVQCDYSFYQPSRWQDMCFPCNTSYTTNNTGSTNPSDCKFLCPPGNEDLGNQICQPCQQGYFRSNSLADRFRRCTVCNATFTTAGIGSTSSDNCNITACSPGYMRNSSTNQCVQCAVGYYQPLKWQDMCLQCNANYTTANTASTSASDCRFYCQPGYEVQTPGVTTCSPCSRGKYKTNNGDDKFRACQTCSSGMTTDGTAAWSASFCNIALCKAGQVIMNGSCVPCPANFYQTETVPFSYTKCTACPSGTGTRQNGETSLAACLPMCGPGQQYNTTVSQCVACPQGTWNSGNASQQFDPCAPCPATYVTVGEGATSADNCTLKDCPPGQYIATNDSCKPCPLATYQSARRQYNCTACPAGTNTSRESTTDVRDCTTYCEKGFRLNSAGKSCDPCEVGFYKDQRGNSFCIRCPANSTTTDVASTSINQCIANCTEGQHRVPGGCKDCPIGTYQPEKSQDSCIQCPFGTTTLFAGQVYNSSCVDDCADGTAYSTLAKVCEKCVIGYYRKKNDTVSCIKCSPGKTTVIEGASRCIDLVEGTTSSPSPVIKKFFMRTAIRMQIEDCSNTVQIAAAIRRFILNRLLSADAMFPQLCASDCQADLSIRFIGGCLSNSRRKKRSTDQDVLIQLANVTEEVLGTDSSGISVTERSQDVVTRAFYDTKQDASLLADNLLQFVAIINTTMTEQCNPGQRIDGTSCVDCSAGYYSTNGTSSMCTPCEMNTYQDTPGQASCKPCSANTYSNITASTSSSNCIKMTSPTTTATPLQNCEMPRLNLQESCGNDSKTWGYCYRENTACVYPKTRWDYGERTCQCVHGTVMVVDDASNFTCVDIYQLFRENISRQLASDVEPSKEVYSGSLTFNDLEITLAEFKYSLYPSDSWLSVTKNGLNFSVITNKRLPQANAIYFFVLRVDVDSYNYGLHITDTTTLNITVIHTFLKASEVGVFLLDGSRKGTIVYDVTSALGSIDNTDLKLQTDTAVTLFELQSNRRIVCVKDVDINSIRISSDAIGHVVTVSLTSSGQVVLVVKVAVIVASTRLTIPENNLPNKNVVTFSSLRESFDIAEQHRPVDLPLILTPNRTAIQLTRGLDFEKDPKSFQVTVSLQFRPSPQVSTSVSITVDVTDINDSPPRFLQSVYIIIAPYCSENGTLLGQLAVEDQDSMTQTFSFQIIPSRNSSLFRIRDSAGILEATKKLPEDAGANGIVINVTVSDGVNTSPTPTTAIIYVSRYIQEFELVGGNYSLSIVENIPVGTEVFNASLTNYTGYQLLPASVLYFFTINQTTGIIRTRSEIDREGRVPQENMNVVAFQQNDVCKLKTVSNITLTILDENDNPPVFDTSVTYAVSIAENSANGAFVFKFSATDKDYKENATLTYSITSGNSPFRIDSATGNVTVADSSRLDREVLDTLRLVVTVVDGGTTLPQNLRKSASINFTVTLTDVNDNDPIFNQNVYTVSVYENISVNSNLTVVRATDRDINYNGEVRYSLGDGVGIGSFTIDYMTGQLRNRVALDREQYESFTFTVIAFDLGSPPRSSSATVVVKVLDVNDNIPQFQKAVYLPSPIDEGISCWNKSFVTVTAEDKDSGLNSEIVYSIESDLLAINSSTGEVTCKAAGLDYENVTQRTFDVVVRASDKGTPPLTSTSVIRVTVRDVNDNAPVFINAPYNISVRVETFDAFDSPIFVFSVQDKDSGENSEVDLRLTNPSTNGAGLLTVSNLVLRVNRTGSPAPTNFSYTVIATDRGRPPLSSSASVYIYVSNSGTSRVTFDPKDFLFKIVEEKSYDESSGTAIGKLTITKQSFPPVFSLVGANSFSVNSSTGHLFSSKVWDRERDKDSAELTILANASVGADVDYALVKITLLDINDNSPSILTNPSALVGSVREDAKKDTFIISLEATDPDEGPNGTVIFSMEDGMPFRIETANTTGKIFVNGSLDRELKNEYIFTVWVRDNATEPRSVSVSVTILIDDVNDNAPIFVNVAPIFVPENTSKEQEVGMVSATDLDQGNNGMVTFSIYNSSACPLRIRADVGVLLLRDALDYETVKNYTCIIEASDQGDPRLSSTANFTILVTDINDNAPVIHSAVSSVNVTRDIDVGYVLVESLNVTDADSVSKGAISFHFVDPANTSAPVDTDTGTYSYFNITPATGAISMKKSISNFPEDDAMLTIVANDTPVNQPTLWSNRIQIQVHILDASTKPQFNGIDSINITEGPLTSPRVLTRVSAFVYENKVRVDPCNCSYSINNTELGNGSSLKGTFSINAVSGEITLNASLDREATGNIIFITLFASDFGSPPKTGSATLNVSVVDINDNIPKFSTDSYQITVTESSCSEGQVLYNITAHDADEPPNNIIVYSLHQLSPDTPLVKIDNSSGQLSPVTSLCLNDTVITAIATATDLMDSDKQSFVPLKISVKVNDPNPNAPEFLKNMYQINLTLTGTEDTTFTIPDFEAKDKDEAQTITYSIESGNCLDLFELNSQTCEFKLKHPNCTTTIPPMVNLSVKATDSGDFPLNFRKSGNTMVQIKIVEKNKPCDIPGNSAPSSATEKLELFMGLFIAVIILLAIAIIICVIFIYKWKTAVSGSSPITAPEITPYKHSLMEPRFTKISKKKSVDTPGFPPNLPKRSNAGLSSGPGDSEDSGVSSQWIPSDQSLDSAGYLAPSDRQYSWEEEDQGSLGDEDRPGRTSYLTVIPDPNGHQSDNPGVDDLASPQFVHVQLDSNPPPCEPKHGTYLRATKESPKSRDTYLHPTQVSQPAFPPSPPREDDVPPEAFIRPSPLGILYRPRDSPTGLNRQGFGVPSPGHVQAQEGHDPYILREGRGSSQT